MKRMKRGLYILGGAVAGLAGAVPAMAEEWTPTVTLSTTAVETVAGVVVGALAAIWAIRKVIKLMTHS